ncbi:MAG: potassium transporter Kup [Gemmatimonadetes bacterium]|nr:potassium transporter Kup [Gemmatimonadota bacterium]
MTHDGAPTGARLGVLSVAAIGVVYGDIGTSPIYAIREALHVSHGVEPVRDTVLGILSMIFWSLVIVISVKYLFFILRADNEGEGGIIALTALVSPRGPSTRRRRMLMLAGLFGAALLYGDSMITPAISVLSAVEGLQIAVPAVEPFVIPAAVAILIALFSVQYRGTERVGALFGPVMILWFLTLGVLGIVQLVQDPQVLAAVSPHFAVRLFTDHPMGAFLVLGSVFLVVTGGEALYADLGHFGTRPIRLMWFSIVLPGLLLNYFGQGALIITNPQAAEAPFFLMAPSWALLPLVVLTTAATVIASQAVISGAFSLTRQAVLLGYLPRLRIAHTSKDQAGQVYMPLVNWGLMIASVSLVLGFRTSSNLAAAYGMAVTTDMVFTTILFAVVALRVWRWSPLTVVGLISVFLVVDIGFWGANLHKLPHGGWFPLIVAAVMFVLMTTWKRGRQILSSRLRERVIPLEEFVENLEQHPPIRVPGTAVFLSSDANGVPPALLHNLKHNRVMHERVIFLTISVGTTPTVDEANRIEISTLGGGMFRITVQVGFSEEIDVPGILARCDVEGGPFAMMQTSYFLGRERIIATARPGMAIWREKLFAVMTRNAEGITGHFNLPPNRIVELGMQVEI